MEDCPSDANIAIKQTRTTGDDFPSLPKNSEENSEFFEFTLEIVAFCPKSANFAVKQGINSEFCGNLPKLLSTKQLTPSAGGFQEISRE